MLPVRWWTSSHTHRMFNAPRDSGASDRRPSSSPWMTAIEAEFGSLKRALERRERQRFGLLAEDCASSVSAAVAADALRRDAHGLDEGADVSDGNARSTHPTSTSQASASSSKTALLDIAEIRSYDSPVPLLTSDTTNNDEIRRAHARHNRTIATHVEQWQRGSEKVNTLSRAVAASHHELEAVVAEAQLVHADPPSIDSKSTTSNYHPIRETLRAIAALGSGIDDSDESPNDFGFLVEDANLSAREKILMHRLRDTAAKLKTATQEIARLNSAWKEFQLEVARDQHEASEAHREELQEATREWEETRQILADDVAHWKHSSQQLMQELTDCKAAAKMVEEQSIKTTQELLTEHKAEIATWMNTVAASDREKHSLHDKLRAAEASVELLSTQSGTSLQRVSDLEERCKLLDTEVARLSNALESLTTAHQSASQELSLLQAARPQVAHANLQVDTDALILDMKLALETQRREATQLRHENESNRTKLLTNAADIAALEVIRRQFAGAQEEMSEEKAARVVAEKSVRRLVQRRLQLVASNFCLRAQLLRLQRPNGFGEKMSELTEENRWLFQKLQRIGAVHQVAPGVVTRLSSEAITEGVDRDVLIHISHTATQCQLLPVVPGGAGRMENGNSPEARDWRDDDTSVGQEQEREARLSEYMSSSIGYRDLQSHFGPYREISHVASRMREALLRDAASSYVEQRSTSPPGPLQTAANAAEKGEPALMLHHLVTNASTQQGSSAKAQTYRRPASAASAVSSTTHSVRSGAVASKRSHAPSLEKHARDVPLNQPDDLLTSASSSSLGPQFCVLGHRDDPQQSALTHNPSQFFTLMRQQGLAGTSGKKRQLELQERLANQFSPEDPAEDVRVRDSLPPPFVCGAADAEAMQYDPLAQFARPQSATKWLPTKSLPVATFPVRTMTPPAGTNLDAFMPNAHSKPQGAWKARPK